MARQVSLFCKKSVAQLCIDGSSTFFYFNKAAKPEHWEHMVDEVIALWKSEFPTTKLTIYVEIDKEDLSRTTLDCFESKCFSLTIGTSKGYTLVYQSK